MPPQQETPNFKPPTGNYSVIDLFLCDFIIYLYYIQTVHDGTCGSNHFKIILENLRT